MINKQNDMSLHKKAPLASRYRALLCMLHESRVLFYCHTTLLRLRSNLLGCVCVPERGPAKQQRHRFVPSHFPHKIVVPAFNIRNLFAMQCCSLFNFFFVLSLESCFPSRFLLFILSPSFNWTHKTGVEQVYITRQSRAAYITLKNNSSPIRMYYHNPPTEEIQCSIFLSTLI